MINPIQVSWTLSRFDIEIDQIDIAEMLIDIRIKEWQVVAEVLSYLFYRGYYAYN